MFTEAQIERVLEIRRAVYAKADLHGINIKTDDVALLVKRIDDLTDPDHLLGAEALMKWVKDRLAEDLKEKREWLADALEQMRVAELQVKEAEHALSAVTSLLDDGMYVSGAEIIERWDAMQALYMAQGMLPVIPEPVQIEAPAQAEPDPAPEPEPLPPIGAPEPPAPVAKPRPTPAPVIPPGEQENRLYETLKTLAAGAPEVQARLATLGEASGIPKGSCHAVLQRLQTAGRITIIKPPTKNNVPQPNVYRFTDAAAEAVPEAAPQEDEPAPEPDPPEVEAEPPEPEPVPAAVVAEKLAEAWGAKVKPKPYGAVTQSAPLRERILAALHIGACTATGLASMLGVKELSVSQTLSAMEHEGSVSPEQIPETGMRARLWRVAPEPSAA